MTTLVHPMAAAAADDGLEIAGGLRRRDPDLLDHLIERYHYRLLRYLVFLTGDHALAEDLFQETRIRVLERGHRYDGRARFVAWLLTVARNLALDSLRKRRVLSLDALTSGTDDEPPLGAIPTVLTALERRPRRNSIASSLWIPPATAARASEPLAREEGAAPLRATDVETVNSSLPPKATEPGIKPR